MSCAVGCRNATGLASRLVDEVEESSMGVGCAEPMERVRDEIDVSGDNVEGAMLYSAPACAVSGKLGWLHNG